MMLMLMKCKCQNARQTPGVLHDPLQRRQRRAVAQESLPLKLQQPVLRHRRRAPVVGGNESHRHLGRKESGFATARGGARA